MVDEEFKRGQYEALKTAYRIFGQGDLMKYWLFEEHHCIDKWVHYFPIYEKWFAPYRGKELVFVEVGVQNGGSAQMWKHYFGKSAQIVGVDINLACKELEEDGITIEIGSQDDPNFWAAFREKYPRVDILLDDGGHMMNQQITTFREMFPHIRDGGLYMCEDCHTSYWGKFGGGLNKPESFIEFCKRLIDEINAFHSNGAVPLTYSTINISGLHFYDSVVVAEKNTKSSQPFHLRIGKTTTVHFADAL